MTTKVKMGKWISILLCITCAIATVATTISGSFAQMTKAIQSQVQYCKDDIFYKIDSGAATVLGASDEAVNVNIPASIEYSGMTYPVTTLYAAAFFNAYSLETLHLPNSITTAPTEMNLIHDTKLRSITADAGGTAIAVENNAIYTADKTKLIAVAPGMTGTFNVPSTVTTIATNCFVSSQLTTVNIPASVTELSISVDNKVGVFNVDAANPNYTSVDGVIYNKDVTELLAMPGAKTGNLNIPNTVTTVSRVASESQYTSVTIPASLVDSNSVLRLRSLPELLTFNVDAGNTAYMSKDSGLLYTKDETSFVGCPRAKSGAITVAAGTTEIGGKAFQNCDKITSISLPNGLTTISNYAFYICSALTSVNLPDTVTSIGTNIFQNCINLTTVTGNPAVTKVSTRMFSNCPKLTSFNIPQGVTTIYSQAFYGCACLTNITIPNTVTGINSSAFQMCTGLQSVNIPSSVTSIGDYAFSNLADSAYPIAYPAGATVGTQVTVADEPTVTLPNVAAAEQRIKAEDITADSIKESGNSPYVIKSAKWTNTSRTEAEIDFNFYNEVKQSMDYIFILDASASMVGPNMGSMYYNMKAINKALLTTPGYNNRVAMTSFADKTISSLDFTSSVSAADYYIDNKIGYGDSTGYNYGTDDALRLMENRADKSRDVAVIFMTDGVPSPGPVDKNAQFAGTSAQKMRDLGATTYAIAYNASGTYLKGIAGSEDRIYSANVASLNNVFNSVINNNKNFTLTDVISDDFDLNTATTALTPSAGTTAALDGKIVTWTLNNIDINKNYDLKIKIKLNAAGSANASDILNTNNGLATVKNTTLDKQVSSVTSPEINKKYIITGQAQGSGTVTPNNESIIPGSSKDVVITANSGYAIQRISVNGSDVEFTNRNNTTLQFTNISKDINVVAYFAKLTTESTSIPFTKTVTGQPELAADKQFTFKIEAVTPGAPMPTNIDANGNITVTGPGAYSFSGMTFDDIHVGNTYTYRVSEVAGSTANMSYDNTKWNVIIVPQYDEDGGITATISTKAEGATEKNPINFVNNYSPFGKLIVSKTVSGPSGNRYKAFNFTVKLAKGTTNYTGTVNYTGTGIADGTLSFNASGIATIALKHGQSIEITNAPYGYTYTVTEATTTGYKTYVGATANGLSQPTDGTLTNVATGTISGTTSTAAFLNYGQDIPNTGFGSSFIPFLILMTLGFGGIATFLTIKSKRRYDEII